MFKAIVGRLLAMVPFIVREAIDHPSGSRLEEI